MSNLKRCPQCDRTYTAADRFCTVDGAALVSVGQSDSLIGSVIAERYLVHERLGAGGMGEVYLAQHVRIKRKVAVKVMRHWMLGDPVAVSRFHREAENASQITHPNVAQVYDFGETPDGVIYLAMEFVPGEPLSEILAREGRLNAVRAAEIVRQTADALVAAHGLGILHRDLKPDNVMIARTRTGTDLVKLVDFGIARAMDRGTQQFTSTGMIVGTPDYMSPEQLAGDALDQRSDLYALALIAFRALTGHPAFPEGGGDALIARLMNRPRTLADVAPDVAWPASLQQAFDRALNADPAGRHADALELAAELDGAISAMPLSADDQAYLVLLSQRMATPTRLGALGDGTTPSQPVAAAGIETPGVPHPSVAVATPPDATVPERTVPPAQPPAPAAGDAAHSPALPPAAGGSASHTTAPPVNDAAASLHVSPPAGTTPATATPAVSIPAAATPDAAMTAMSSSSAQSPAATTPPRRRWHLAAAASLAGVVALTAWGVFTWRQQSAAAGSTAASPGDTSAAAGDTSASSLASAAVPQQLPGGAPSAVSPADSARLRRADDGVLAIEGGARGTGALVDVLPGGNTGIVLTAASLVSPDRPVEVFIERDRKLRASVLATDQASGVAALLISLRGCRNCRSLEMAPAEDEAHPVTAGDSLVALVWPARGAMRRTGYVAGDVSATRVAASPAVPPSATGAPLILARNGVLIGLVGRRGSAAIVPAAALDPIVRAAREAARTAVADDTVYWGWPVAAASEAAVRDAASWTETALQPYQVDAAPFRILAMTPRVVAWRASKSPTANAELNPFEITAPPTDPLLKWVDWDVVRTERRAVLVLEIAPQKAAFPTVPTRLLDPRDGDFHSMEFKRDGLPLRPITSQRVPAVLNDAEYRRGRARPVPNTGIYVFHPADVSRPDAVYTVEIVDNRDRASRISVTLPPALMQRVAEELARR